MRHVGRAALAVLNERPQGKVRIEFLLHMLARPLKHLFDGLNELVLLPLCIKLCYAVQTLRGQYPLQELYRLHNYPLQDIKLLR